MSEDPNQSPDESGEPESQEQPSYPPPPEFYAHPQPVGPDPYGAPVAEPPFPPTGYSSVPAFPPPPREGYGYGYEPPPRARPLPLGEAIRALPGQYKRIFFKPGPQTFAEEQSKAAWNIIWVQLLFIMALEILVAVVSVVVSGNTSSAVIVDPNSPSAVPYSTLVSFEATTVAFLAPLFFLASFFATVGIQYLLAKAFHGLGSFKQQAYNQLLFQVPIGVVSVVISLVVSPFSRQMAQSFFIFPTASTQFQTPPMNPSALVALLVLELLVTALSIYGVVLNVFSIMAVHRLSGGKASGTVLIPYGVLVALVFLVFCGLFFIALIAAASVMH